MRAIQLSVNRLDANSDAEITGEFVEITPDLAAQIVALSGEHRAQQMSDPPKRTHECGYCKAQIPWGELGPTQYHDCKGGTLKAPLNAVENAAVDATWPAAPSTPVDGSTREALYDVMRDGCPAGEYVSNKHIAEFADAILAAVKAGKVPGVWWYDEEGKVPVMKAKNDEIAALRARVAELESQTQATESLYVGISEEAQTLRVKNEHAFIMQREVEKERDQLKERVAELETDGTAWADRLTGMTRERDEHIGVHALYKSVSQDNARLRGLLDEAAHLLRLANPSVACSVDTMEVIISRIAAERKADK